MRAVLLVRLSRLSALPALAAVARPRRCYVAVDHAVSRVSHVRRSKKRALPIEAPAEAVRTVLVSIVASVSLPDDVLSLENAVRRLIWNVSSRRGAQTNYPEAPIIQKEQIVT